MFDSVLQMFLPTCHRHCH